MENFKFSWRGFGAYHCLSRRWTGKGLLIDHLSGANNSHRSTSVSDKQCSSRALATYLWQASASQSLCALWRRRAGAHCGRRQSGTQVEALDVRTREFHNEALRSPSTSNSLLSDERRERVTLALLRRQQVSARERSAWQRQHNEHFRAGPVGPDRSGPDRAHTMMMCVPTPEEVSVACWPEAEASVLASAMSTADGGSRCAGIDGRSSGADAEAMSRTDHSAAPSATIVNSTHEALRSDALCVQVWDRWLRIRSSQ